VPYTVNVGQFYHVAMVVTSTTSVSFYINGVPQTVAAGGTIVYPSVGYLVDFGLFGGYNYQLKGKIAMARVYGTALTAAQVQQNYVSAFSKLTGTVPYVMTGLLGYWDFGDSTSFKGKTYPPQPFTQSAGAPPVTQSMTNPGPYAGETGSYIVTVSTYLNTVTSGQYAFDLGTVNSGTTNGWFSSGAAGVQYVSGNYIGSTNTTVNGTTKLGEWIQLQVPIAFILGSYSFQSRSDNQSVPTGWVLAGSNDGSTWSSIDTQTGISWASGSLNKTFTVSSSTAYLYYRMITNTINYTSSYLTLQNLRFISGSGFNVLDFGPNSYNLSFSGMPPSYNSSGALSFNGNGSNIASTSSTVSLNLTGGFTFEALINLTATGSNQVISYGNSSSSVSIQMNSTTVAVNAIGYGGFAVANYTAPLGQWIHVVCVFNTLTYTTASVYVNGVSYPITSGINFTSFPNNPSGYYLSVGSIYGYGSTTGINGKFAMGRIYGIPLSASQVRQNYSAVFSKLNSDPYVLPPPLNLNLAFPPIPLTSSPMSMTSQTYGNGQYITNASSIYNSTFASYVVTNTSGVWWATPVGLYNTSSPFNCTSGRSLGGVSGEWVTVQLPVPLLLNSYSFGWQASLLESPNIWSLLGSNDGSTWTILDSNRNYTFTTSPQQVLFTPSTIITSYTTFGIVVTNVQGNSSGQLGFAFLKFYGTPVSSLAVPPGLPYWTSSAQYTTTNLTGYWDFALTPSSSLSGVNLFDLSGLGNNISFPSAPTYVTSPPSYTSTTTSYANNYLTINYSAGGFTYECLFYLTSLPSGNGYLLNHWTNGYSTGSFGLGITSTGAIGIITSGNVGGNYQTGTGIITTGKWYHVVVVNNAQAIYLNGVSQIIGTNVAQSGFPGAAYQPFYIGNQYNNTSLGIQGNIAMARVYSSSLTYQQAFSNYSHCVLKAAGTYFPTSAPTPASVGWTATSGGVSELFPSSTIPTSSPLVSPSAGTIPVFNATLTNTTVGSVTYGSGLHVVSASDSQVYNSGGVFYSPIAAFLVGGTSSYPSACEWVVSGSVYSSSSPYLYASTFTTFCKTNTIVYPGAWLQIQLPAGVILTSYNLTSPNNAASLGPNTWVLLGSVDGVSWILLDSQSGITWATANLQKTFTPATISTAYNYYRISIQNANQFGYTGITLWQIYAKW